MRLPSINDHWERLETIQEVVRKLAEAENNIGSTVIPSDLETFLSDIRAALTFAHRKGFEGQPGDKGRVFWLPEPHRNRFRYTFAWKQDNNGPTLRRLALRAAMVRGLAQ